VTAVSNGHWVASIWTRTYPMIHCADSGQRAAMSSRFPAVEIPEQAT